VAAGFELRRGGNCAIRAAITGLTSKRSTDMAKLVTEIAKERKKLQATVTGFNSDADKVGGDVDKRVGALKTSYSDLETKLEDIRALDRKVGPLHAAYLRELRELKEAMAKLEADYKKTEADNEKKRQELLKAFQKASEKRGEDLATLTNLSTMIKLTVSELMKISAKAAELLKDLKTATGEAKARKTEEDELADVMKTAKEITVKLNAQLPKLTAPKNPSL
jgi:chromosome segregation ATPase